MKLTEQKREAIINAAIAEFKDNGFACTSMDNVAKRAEVSKRTVYNHFSSKDELFTGIMTCMFNFIAEVPVPAYQANKPIKEQLLHIVQSRLNIMSSEQCINFSKVVLSEAVHNPDRIEQAMEQIAELEAPVLEWFAQAMSDNKLTQHDPQMYCDKLFGLIKMECFWPRIFNYIDQPTEQDLQQMADDIVGMFLSYYQV